MLIKEENEFQPKNKGEFRYHDEIQKKIQITSTQFINSVKLFKHTCLVFKIKS